MSERRGSLTARIVAVARGIGAGDVRDDLATEVLPTSDAIAVRIGREIVELGGLTSLLANAATGGLTGHAALRMRAVDDAVRRAVTSGCQQVVVIGAGYDTRAWRLSELAQLHVVEIDLPATQEAKRRRFADRFDRTDVEFVAADLARNDLGGVLDATSLDVSLPIAWVWEAVAMYLPPEAVAATLRTVADRSVPGSHLAMTFLSPQLLGSGVVGRSLDGIVRRAFELGGEPLLTAHEDAELRVLLADHGFEVTRITGSTDWARDVGVRLPRDLFAAERLAEATA